MNLINIKLSKYVDSLTLTAPISRLFWLKNRLRNDVLHHKTLSINFPQYRNVAAGER